jgi:hypothetical protein
MTIRTEVLEATLALIRASANIPVATGGASSPRLTENFDWHGLVAFSSAHLVLPAMAQPVADAAAAGAPVPDDLVQFLNGTAVANAARNRRLKSALCVIGRALNEVGISPVVLKGGVFLLTDTDDAAGWRFMSDLDLLIPPERLGESVRVLERLGYRVAPTDYEPQTHAHFPPLWSPCGEFPVELHTRLFGLHSYGLDPAAVMDESVPTTRNGGPCLRVPSPRHRIAHLLAHAQLHNRNHAARRLVLKDVLDLAKLPREDIHTFETQDMAGIFIVPAHRAAVESLLVAWRHTMDMPATTTPDARALAWASDSIGRLEWPRWRHLAQLPIDALLMELHRLRHEPGHGARRASLVANPARAMRNGRTWAFKQRQRLWS